MVSTQFSLFTGMNAYEKISGRERRDAFNLHYCQLFSNYGDNVEFQLTKELIVPDGNIRRLYEEDAVIEPRYRAGTRPVLEEAVAKAIGNAFTNREKMFCLMRFCRDLYKKNPYPPAPGTYIFGGTEEQLIEKGEFLCECEARLMTALCEVAGIPARIAAHIIGGHYTNEVYTEDGWTYIDPRMGLYFLDRDGRGLSILDLMRNPSLTSEQPGSVRAEVVAYDTWHHRVWAAEHIYFHPLELNGFAYYSLADAAKYTYEQLSRGQVLENGLYVYNKPYGALSNKIFSLAETRDRLSWDAPPPEKLAINYRNDGYSQYYAIKPPVTREILEEREINCFANTNVTMLTWGVGPGSVVCYPSRILDPIGTDLSESEWKAVREGDRWAAQNIRDLTAMGLNPLRIAAERGHELGLTVFARLEMNHEYIAPTDKPGVYDYIWGFFVGKFNKSHPEYRIGIPDSTGNLDYKFPEVRALKIGVFREALEAGMDGITLDFCVYLPHFKEPDCAIMTHFMRDVRDMADTFTPRRAISVRVPWKDAEKEGLDWKTWMKEGLIDFIEPAFRWERVIENGRLRMRQYQDFDIDAGEFVSSGNRTGVKVIGSMFFGINIGITLDPRPGDTEKGIVRYNKAKTIEHYNAQALTLFREGVHGFTLDCSGAGTWKRQPFCNDLAEFKKVEFADKTYMLNRVFFNMEKIPAQPWLPVEEDFPVRIADDLVKAAANGLKASVSLRFQLRPMKDDEILRVLFNGEEIAKLSAEHGRNEAPVDPSRTDDDGWQLSMQKDWFRKGERIFEIPAGLVRMKDNMIGLIFSKGTESVFEPLIVPWMELFIHYEKTS